jgi:N-acetylneuraminic acid mutarotase
MAMTLLSVAFCPSENSDDNEKKLPDLTWYSCISRLRDWLMAKKDKAAAAAAKKQRALAKTLKKGDKKTKKSNAQANSDDEDQDIDQILADYAAAQSKKMEISEEQCTGPPSTRINASLTVNPLKSEVVLFGGEHFDGSLATFFDDLFVYNVHKNTWTKVSSANSPLPRSSHQTVVHKNSIFLMGGEFSSPKQNTFYHYSDFWSLDCSTRAWTKIETKISPSARSGHRMASVGKYIVLFGGFQDTSAETRYLGDLWAFDTDYYEWHEVKLTAVSQKPDPRSGCTFCAAGTSKEEAILFGGYTKKKISGKLHKGVILNDYWTLKIVGEPGAGTWAWSRRKRPASPPSQRIGASAALHRNRLIYFGGVYDHREAEETLESSFYNDLWCLSIEANRWFPLKVRPPRKQNIPKKQIEERNKGQAREDDLAANARQLEAKFAGTSLTPDEEDDEIMAEDVDVALQHKRLQDVPLTQTMPHPRMSAAMAVSGDLLYIYGGIWESGEKEYDINDMHVIDLAKLDGVRKLFGQEVAEPIVESESEEDSEMDEEEEEAPKSVFFENIPDEKPEEDAPDDDGDVPVDPRPMPRPFEDLRPYFMRTVEAWQTYLLPWNQTCSPKELRTKAFVRAEDYWWVVREEIRALEDQMEESGIGEVIETAEENAGKKGVVGQRR